MGEGIDRIGNAVAGIGNRDRDRSRLIVHRAQHLRKFTFVTTQASDLCRAFVAQALRYLTEADFDAACEREDGRLCRSLRTILQNRFECHRGTHETVCVREQRLGLSDQRAVVLRLTAQSFK